MTKFKTARQRRQTRTDFEFSLIESLIFPVLLCLQLCTEPPSSEGAMEGSKAFKLHTNEGILWAYLFPSTTRSEGGGCGRASMVQLNPMTVVPAGQKGE